MEETRFSDSIPATDCSSCAEVLMAIDSGLCRFRFELKDPTEMSSFNLFFDSGSSVNLFIFPFA